MIGDNILLTNDAFEGGDLLALHLVGIVGHSSNIARNRQEHQYVLMDILYAGILATVEFFYQFHHYLYFLPSKVQPLSKVINVREGFLFF